MNRHLLRLIWNRKRHNLLLSIEIFFSFLVVLGVATLVLNVGVNWMKPLGYRIDNVWRINLNNPYTDREGTPAIVKEIIRTVRALPPVEMTAAVSMPPYESGEWGRSHGVPRISMRANAADDHFAELIGLDVVAGRWFSAEDTATGNVRAVVINRSLATTLFQDSAAAVGQILPFERKPDPTGWVPPAERVVGVIDDFRQHGELSTSQPYIFGRINLDRVGHEREAFANTLLIRVHSGTTADFEQTLLDALRPIASDWTFSVATLEDQRADSFRGYLLPIAMVGIVAGFLLLMVALGLTGVVWQIVTERTREFGLRRAMGAAGGHVQRQVLTEVALIASLAVVPAVLLAAQVPVLPMPPDWVIPDGVFLAAVVLSAASIYLVVLACAWYPSRLATRIQPAEALHYE